MSGKGGGSGTGPIAVNVALKLSQGQPKPCLKHLVEAAARVSRSELLATLAASGQPALLAALASRLPAAKLPERHAVGFTLPLLHAAKRGSDDE